MPRGGKRPGAGAPAGNFNNLRHGGRSLRFRALVAALASAPRYRELVLAIARRRQAGQRRAERVAAQLLLAFLANRAGPSGALRAPVARLQAALHRRPSPVARRRGGASGAARPGPTDAR